MSTGCFYYFAFGSNLLTRRIRIRNPSAVFVGVGQLDNFTFKFEGISTGYWNGASANIRQKMGDQIFGSVWRLGNEHSETLDEQELGYNRLSIDVILTQPKEDSGLAPGSTIKCRTYQQKDDNIGSDNRPSPLYHNVVLAGARESGLPQEYIQRLAAFEHNGYQGTYEGNNLATPEFLKVVPSS